MTITEMGVLVIINIVSIFVSSYISEKAKNKAIKKDIGEITSKIKSVESAIQEISSKKQDKFFQFRTAITDFANDLTILVEWKYKTIPIGNDLIDPSVIKEGFLGFISHWATVNSSYRRVILFSNVDNDFATKIWEQFQIILNQYKITIELYDHGLSL